MMRSGWLLYMSVCHTHISIHVQDVLTSRLLGSMQAGMEDDEILRNSQRHDHDQVLASSHPPPYILHAGCVQASLDGACLLNGG